MKTRRSHPRTTRDSLFRSFAVFSLTLIAGMIPASGARNATASMVQRATNAVEYDVRSYGAKGDGKTVDSPAVNRAIDAASSAGGGTVRFPAGTYLCFSIHLKSNITLYLDPGSTIVAADPVSDGGKYDPPEPNKWDMYQDFGHSHWHNSLIWGDGIENAAILGQGRIWGRGLVRENKVPEGGGNKSISLKLCRNVLIRDVSILHGGHFAILATGVDLLTIDNVKIDTNRDGIDIDCCRSVRVSNCGINSPFDDALCLKSSYGLGFARATENVTITNCQVSGYDEGSFLDGTFKRGTAGISGENRTGRIKFGTESNGGFKNITISNCVFDHCRGLALETVDGGLLEDVTIDNITMRDVTSAPIFLRLGNRARGPKDTTTVGRLRRVTLSNFVVYGSDSRWASIISGIPGHDIEDVRLNNIRIYYQGGGTAEQAALEPPERETAYPEPTMFGDTPSYGFYIRHVKGLKMTGVEVSYMKPDARPALVLDQVRGADLQHVVAQTNAGNPTFVLKHVEDFSTHQCGLVPDRKIERASLEKF